MERIKTHFFNKLAEKSNEFRGILEFEKLACKSYVFLYPSFESYVKRERLSMDRMIKYWLLITSSIIWTFKYAVLSVHNEEWLLAMLGEFTYKLYKIKIMAYFGFLVSCICTLTLLMRGYFESRHKFYCLDLLYHLSRKSRAYRLEANNEKKYSISSYLLFEFFLRKQLNTITLIMTTGFIFCAVSAYLGQWSWA